jgi:HTH-type transcriptional regulator / antitoxin HigA
MIFSDRQLTVSRAQRDKLRAAFSALAPNAADADAWLRDIERDALTSQIADLEAEISEYEMLKAGHVSFAERFSLAELPRVLIQARIAKGLSQTDLATKLNMKAQQIQRYETTDYMGASLARLIEISEILGVRTSGSFATEAGDNDSLAVWTDSSLIPWERFPTREMVKRGWFDLKKGANAAEAVKSYFLRAAGSQFATALHRKKVRSGNPPNQPSLLAWQARILELARTNNEIVSYPPFEFDERWLPDLVALTKEEDGPAQAQYFLETKGIALVVEPHLPGSFLDGAAMTSDFDRPLIGLTLRYDRLDNFWFVLFHEIGHVFLHLQDSLHFDFFDEEGIVGNDHLEVEADKFALDTLIAPELWDQCLSRFALSKESVLIDAEALGIHPSIVAGRIRKERNDYTILTDLVGQNTVRRNFEEQT